VILVAIQDLYFASKIDATRAGIARADRTRPVVDQVRELAPTRLILHLSNPAAIETIRAIKSDPALAATEIVAFVGHTQTALIAEAKSAGADRVLSQGELAQQLATLLT
jgi:DNA-binding NarL/FixJ family response regulator